MGAKTKPDDKNKITGTLKRDLKLTFINNSLNNTLIEKIQVYF
jgi:hypothetical protein